MAVCQRQMCLLTLPLREQAPSHIWIVCIQPEHQAQQFPAANSLRIGQSGR